MKHVFIIHSNITLIVADQIVREESIIQGDVLYLTTRNFKPTTNFKTIDGSKFFIEYDEISYSNFWKGWRYIRNYDHFIKTHIQNNYTCYVPHVAHPFFQILISNLSCINVNVIEEGASSLAKSHFIQRNTLKFRLIDLIFNRLGLYGKKRYFRNQSNIDFNLFSKKLSPVFYKISPTAFDTIKTYQKKQLPLPVFETGDKSLFENGSIILVLEAILEQGNISERFFFSAINQLINTEKPEHIYIKFHPVQSESNISKILDICKKISTVEIIDNNVILEFEFLKAKDLKVIGFTTSLLLYAHLFGHQTASYAALWLEDPLFQKYRSYNDFIIPNQFEI